MIENPVRYLVFRGQVIRLERQRNDFWEDDLGGIYAFSEANSSADLIDRCGVYPWVLPEGHPLNDACAPSHDYAYSSPVYQLYHTREEADKKLLQDLKLISGTKWYKILAWPFYFLTRVFGKSYWENPKTR